MRNIKFIYNSFYNRLKNDYCERKDFRTDRHIVIFESDDWGSIRMSNKKDWNALLKLGYAVDRRPYERFDTLESPEDIEALFDVLRKHKDCHGNHPIITANMLMANPDFERIEKSGFQTYYYESIPKTYERYFGTDKVLELMKQGMDEGLFMPQSHGREHFNVAEWMQGLQAGDEDLVTAFKFSMCGISPKSHPEQGNNMMVALRARNGEEQQNIEDIVYEGLQMFEQLWRIKSKTFVAPCYCWSEQIEQILSIGGVELIQTVRAKKNTFQSPERYYYSGKRNKCNQVYSIRNCSFEPATNIKNTTVNALIKQVDDAFAKHKIATFSSHRINYVGGINVQNRETNLTLLDIFIKALMEKYPNVEFMSSDKLIPLFE